MITTNLSGLKINKLTKAQYEAAKTAGTLNEQELYMTPSEDVSESGLFSSDISGVALVLMTHNVTFVDNEGSPTMGYIRTSDDNSGMTLTGVVPDETDPTSAVNYEQLEQVYSVIPSIFYDTTDLTAGTSELPEGTFWFVYE